MIGEKIKNLLKTEKPEHWDGFCFTKNPSTGEVEFYYFTEFVDRNGPPPKDPKEDRDPYHVLLTSVRKGKLQIEAPFRSNFFDPFEYAKSVGHSGFDGFMYNARLPEAEMLVALTLLDLLKRGIDNFGQYVYNGPEGTLEMKGT